MILNYIKSLCTIIYPEIFGYSNYIYCLQEESTHCNLRILTNFGQEVSIPFKLKKSQKTNRQNSQRILH